jgi:hypothetical protein
MQSQILSRENSLSIIDDYDGYMDEHKVNIRLHDAAKIQASAASRNARALKGGKGGERLA